MSQTHRWGSWWTRCWDICELEKYSWYERTHSCKSRWCASQSSFRCRIQLLGSAQIALELLEGPRQQPIPAMAVGDVLSVGSEVPFCHYSTSRYFVPSTNYEAGGGGGGMVNWPSAPICHQYKMAPVKSPTQANRVSSTCGAQMG